MECDICATKLSEDEQYLVSHIENDAAGSFSWRLCAECEDRGESLAD